MTDDSTLWTGDVWKSDDWTEEQKAEARNKIVSSQTTKTNTGVAYQEFRKNASSNWSSFYEQNKTNFFKDRHYLHKAFPNEFGWLYALHSNSHDVKSNNDGGDYKSDVVQNVEEDINTLLQPPNQDDVHIVEIGSGVGNAILPLLEQHTVLVQHQKDTQIPQLHIHCLDFAPSAIKLLKEDDRFQLAAKEGRATGHVYDLSAMHPSTIHIGNQQQTSKSQQPQVLSNSADVAILLFCLSAIGPHPSPSLSRAARHVIDMLKPGGVLVFRDYGRLDEAQLMLGKEADKQLGDNFYRKGDGTGCYYFSLDDLQELFVNQNDTDDKLECLELDYIQRVYRNRGDNTERRRVWVQGRFRKPESSSVSAREEYTSAHDETKLKQYIHDSVSRWNNHYRDLSTESTSSLPSNLFNAFPEEFSPWKSWQQSNNKKGKRKSQQVQPPELNTPSDITIIDAGCGIGNDTILNLIERQQLCYENKDDITAMQPPTLHVHFLDASNEAIQRLHKDSRYQYATRDGDNAAAAANITSQVYNLASTQSTCTLSEQSADIVLLLFTLSAIGPYHSHELDKALQNTTNLLKPGGVVLFRDFGRYDYDQLILNSMVGSQLCDNFYVRGLDDSSSAKGTCCYFFDLGEVRSLFTNAGMEVLQLEYVTRIYKNKKDGTSHKRIWVQGRFKKR